MKVLHIITSLNDGGAEALLYRMCKYDKSNNHIVISLKDKQKYGLMLDKIGVDVYSLNFLNSKASIVGFYKLYQLIKQIKPDVIQTWLDHADLIGGIVGRLAGVKNIVWGVHHVELIKGESKLLTILVIKINSFLSHFIPYKIIYCAEESRKAQEKIGYKKSKGVVVLNGYDTESFTQNNLLERKLRNELSISEDTFLIGHVGRYDPLKDLSNLIEALALLHNRQFKFSAAIIGTDLDTNNLDLVSMVNKNGLNEFVHLLGRRNDINDVMNGIDLFVLSSLSEAFPNVLNEAMLCGTPCVTTNVGDAAYIVSDTGWVVPSRNSKLLADAISQASKEKQLNNARWLDKKDACRQRVINNFSLEKMVKNYNKVWAGGKKISITK
jgi:glycosyltransferase involved in cell wall biosynthesis